MSRNFQFKGYYTFSKSLEGARMQNDTTSGGAQNLNNLAAERGRTDNDRRHNCRDVRHLAGGLLPPDAAWRTTSLDNWMVSGIVTLRSGAPFTVTAGHGPQPGRQQQRPRQPGGQPAASIPTGPAPT